MERKIGEIFKYLDEWYQCLEEKTCTCFGCDFSHHNCDDINLQKVKGSCQSEHRSDKKSVVFKKLEKKGEPFVYKKGTYQTYQLYAPTNLKIQPGEIRLISVCRGNYTAEIEIKQNKKDMEEKKQKWGVSSDTINEINKGIEPMNTTRNIGTERSGAEGIRGEFENF